MLAVLLFGAATLFSAVAAAEPMSPGVKFEGQRGADSSVVEAVEGGVRVAIHSERGIGRGTITRVGAHWPEKLVLRLHLKGLEGLTLTAGDLRLRGELGIGTTDAHRRAEGEWREAEIEESMKLAIERREGAIEVVLPPALLGMQHEQIQVEWIDFYR